MSGRIRLSYHERKHKRNDCQNETVPRYMNFASARLLRDDQQRMEAGVATIGRFLDTLDEVPFEVRSAMMSMQLATVFNGMHVKDMFNMFPVTSRPPRSPAKAEEVFNTTELLTSILEYLPSWDILKAQQVNCKWRDTVEESPTLQMALGLQPEITSALYSPIGGQYGWPGRIELAFPRMGMFYRWAHMLPMPSDEDIFLDVVILNVNTKDLFRHRPRLGPRLRRMQIAQPPAKIITATVIPRGPDFTFHFDDGFTLGDLFNCLAYLGDTWKRRTGEAHVTFNFSYQVTLRGDDPAVKRRR